MNMTIFGCLMLSLLTLDLATGQFRNPQASSKRELGINMVTMIMPFALRALLLVTIGWVLARCLPQWKGVFAHAPLFLAIFVILIADDYLNYWLHRTAHHWLVLWRLHKPHHTPTYLNVLMAGRENTFYYVLVPALWMAPFLIHIGCGPATAVVFGFKAVVTLLQHTGYR